MNTHGNGNSVEELNTILKNLLSKTNKKQDNNEVDKISDINDEKSDAKDLDNRLKDMISSANNYKNNNEHTTNYMNNREVFSEALNELIENYYTKVELDPILDMATSNCKEIDDNEVQKAYKEYYKNEVEYDNECNCDCYSCDCNNNNCTCEALQKQVEKKSVWHLTLHISEINLNEFEKKIAWVCVELPTKQGMVYRNIQQQTSIEDLKNIYNEILTTVSYECKSSTNIKMKVIYNNIDITSLIINDSICG